MQNPWLAIDVSTSPEARARDVRRARERFLADPDAVTGIRAPILESWRRSAATGKDPATWLAPAPVDPDEARARLGREAVGGLAPVLRDHLASSSTDAAHLVVLADADGRVLMVEGDPEIAERARAEINLMAGTVWTEIAAGTNAIGTALATGHSVQVFADEHYAAAPQGWTCSAAPIRDESGDVVGVVDITSPMETVHPHSLALVEATALMLEAHLRSGPAPDGGASARELRFEALGRHRAAVTVDGRTVVLSQRHSEIVVLLASRPEGLTGEQLAIALYGDEGKPVTARAEVSRLRRLLGPCVVLTDPYRLDAVVESDVAEVERRLGDGQAREAAERHVGPLLPRSDAPGIVDLRRELEGWTRRTVMAAGDSEALWAWLQTPAGEDDMHAWKRFLTSIPHGDGRRGLAAARLERLRPLFAPAQAQPGMVAA
jgi:hypothetical protein